MAFFRSSTLAAVAQVAMMPLLLLATLISTVSFVVFTGVAIILAIGLLLLGLPKSEMLLQGAAIAAGAVVVWIMACRGVVVGMQSIFDPDVKALGITSCYAAIAGIGLIALFGSLWNLW